MKIFIPDIPPEGLEIDVVEDFGAETGGVATEARLKLTAERVGSEVLLRGTIRARLSLECSRCLSGFERESDIPVELEYHPAEEMPEAETYELSSGELDTGFYRGEELDLTEISKEQVLLNIPMKPLCGEGCKGICPRCGANLNEKACGCAAGPGDLRFEKLKELFKGRKE
jgi:uncharacterized protein